MIGTILSNRYKLMAELGCGGMAWVYSAQDLKEDRRVAVKVLYPQLGQDIGFVQRFSQEAKLAMSLSRSAPEMHIARVLDYGSDQDTHYLIMEYVEGRDLRQVLDEDGALPWQEALDIGRQVALALGHAAQHGIVHRDIKPENIMIVPDGTVRVLDFGVARARTSPTLTHSGFVGSPYYAAPEQAMGQRVDIRADLYSLGIVFYEMLTGDSPFQSDTPWAVINHHIATPPPHLEETLPDLPHSVACLVRKAMSKRPEDRPQSPAEMVQAIEAVLSGLQLPLDSPDADQDTLAPLLSGIYQRAQQAAVEEEWQEAVDLYSQILRFDPRYRDVVEQLAEAGRQARLSALYSAAGRAMKNSHWGNALAQLNEIARTTPSYRDVEKLLPKATKMQDLERLYRRGADYMEAGEWPAAIECLSEVLAQDPDHASAAKLLDAALAEQEQGGSQATPLPQVALQPARRKLHGRRNVILAIVAILMVALALQSTLLYRSQRPPVIAAVPTASVTSIPAFGPQVATIDVQRTRTVISTATPQRPSSTTMPNRIGDPESDPTAAWADVAAPMWESVASAIPATAGTPTATSQQAGQAGPHLSGQIAFPRFDPTRRTYDVYTCRVDGSRCKRVAEEASQPDLLPGGGSLVVHSWKPDDKGLILQTLDGEQIWKISDVIETSRPSVDFQGQAYVYHSRQDADRKARLYRTYAAGTRPLKPGADVLLGTSPAWLPDGQIVYSGCIGNACGIILVQEDGTDPRQIVAGGSEHNPESSPDGTQIAFMSRRDGNWEIYLVNTDGSGLHRLTENAANDGLPAWSPDGHHIAFVSDRDASWAIWVMNPDGSGQQRLFALGGPLEGQVTGAASHETHGWVEERIAWGPLP